MAAGSLLKRPDTWLVIGATTTAVVLWQFRLRFPFDDTYISFRYAEHLAAGHGLVWNIGGAHTEGYTNFLFILLLSAARLITSDLLIVAQLIGILSTIATGLFLYQIARSLRSSGAGILATLLYYLTPLTWINALSGMETSLFVVLIVLAISRVAKNQLRSAFAIAFLATLTRPEGALLAVLILIVQLLKSAGLLTTREPKHPNILSVRIAIKNWLTWFAMPCLIYAAWKYFYFGELLPNSFYVKVLDSTHSSLPGLQYVRLFVTSVVLLIIASFGLRNLREPSVFVATLWFATLVAFYLFVTPLEGLYDRFLWPAFAVLCFTAAVGITDVSSRFRKPLFLSALILLTAQSLLTSASPRTKQSLAAHEDIWDASMNSVIATLRSLPHSDSLSLGYGDAGYVVYRTGMRHLDLFGLNDTRLSHAKSREERAAIVREEQPDILLLPIHPSDTGWVLIEDAYGLARTTQFSPIGSIDAFPFRLALYLNAQSPYSSEIRAHTLAR